MEEFHSPRLAFSPVLELEMTSNPLLVRPRACPVIQFYSTLATMADHASRDDVANMPGGGGAWHGGSKPALEKMKKADDFSFMKELVLGVVERIMKVSETIARETAKKLAAQKDQENLVTKIMHHKAETLAAAKAAKNASNAIATSEHALVAADELREVARLLGVAARRHGFDESRTEFIKTQHETAAIAATGARKLVDDRVRAEKAARSIYEVMVDVHQQIKPIKGDVDLAAVELDPWPFVHVCRARHGCAACGGGGVSKPFLTGCDVPRHLGNFGDALKRLPRGDGAEPPARAQGQQAGPKY